MFLALHDEVVCCMSVAAHKFVDRPDRDAVVGRKGDKGALRLRSFAELGQRHGRACADEQRKTCCYFRFPMHFMSNANGSVRLLKCRMSATRGKRTLASLTR